MNGQSWIVSGALLGALAVVLGAFGAHGLEDYLTEHGQSENFETAVRYQMYHALALVAVGLLAERRASRSLTVAACCFAAGAVLFSGALYAVALAGVRQLGMVAPIGGTLLIIGWLAMAAAAMPGSRDDR
jgi:uncharacterized membrane protein YgdD (TMEM256/DUF423 family)